MGFFDRFSSKKAVPAPTSSPAPTPVPVTAPHGEQAENVAVPAAAAGPVSAGSGGAVKPRLLAAREQLELKDLTAALVIYEEVLAAAGDRADVLVAISGDLGSHGHVTQIIELIAPRYDADRHGPATGLNILQAYLAVRNPDAAQHVLDILFALNRPELEDRLHGFSNAIAEMIVSGGSDPMSGEGAAPGADAPKVAMISVSKPVWFYGLEALQEKILPKKADRLRRIAFGQLAVLGLKDVEGTMKQPEDELGRLSRAIPLWFADAFSFSQHYAPIAAVGVMNRPDGAHHHVIFGAEWTMENLRQLVDSTEGLDYVFTGAIRQQSGDYELVLRIWEVKKYRERKTFNVRWTPGNADAELAKLLEQVRVFMEWTPATGGLAYVPAPQPRAWLETLATSLNLFLAEKQLLPANQLGALDPALAAAAQHAAASESASLAFLTARARAAKLGGGTAPANAALAQSELVAQAASLLA